MFGRPPRLAGLADENAFVMLERRSELGNSPGEGIEGSLRLRLIAICDLRREERRSSRGLWPPLDDARLSAAFIEAAAANECVKGRGEGVVSRFGGFSA